MKLSPSEIATILDVYIGGGIEVGGTGHDIEALWWRWR